MDFVDNGDSLEQLTLIADDILETYKEGLFVIKSISKSYGIPGIRLGVLASADKKMIKQVKCRLPIWNINSFGEFYMQIAEKYKKSYKSAINIIRQERKIFMSELEQVPFIRLIPSQANYIMCELLEGVTSAELAGYLLESNILIKDLSQKLNNGKQYIRLAVRRREENQYLIQILNQYMESK